MELTLDDLSYMINQNKIRQVKILTLCSHIIYLVGCPIGPLKIKELAQGQWFSLRTLIISKYIVTQEAPNNLEMRDAIN